MPLGSSGTLLPVLSGIDCPLLISHSLLVVQTLWKAGPQTKLLALKTKKTRPRMVAMHGESCQPQTELHRHLCLKPASTGTWSHLGRA